MAGPLLARSKSFGEILPKSFSKPCSEVAVETDLHKWPALTVHQPWAELLISGRKTVEMRTWTPDYRGRIWLHAGLKVNTELERRFGFTELYRGGYVGSMKLLAVVPLTRERWIQLSGKHLDAGEFRSGFFAWMLDEPRRFRVPVSSRGAQLLFIPPRDIQEQLIESEREGN